MLETGHSVSALLGTSSSLGGYRTFFESPSGNSSLPLEKAVSMEKNENETTFLSHLHRSPCSTASKPPLHLAILESRNKQHRDTFPPRNEENFLKNNELNTTGSLELSEIRNLEQNIQNWENLLIRETKLMEQMKNFMINLSHSSGQESQQLQLHYKHLGQEINCLVKMKNNIMCTFFETPDQNQPEINIIQTQIACPNEKLFIEQQPNDTAIANRYIVPAPIVHVSPSLKPSDKNGTLIVTASLFYHLNDNEIKALDGKQDVLQGMKKIPIDKNGTAIFTKLKITEVSSKHRHQAFCLVFSLEEYNSTGKKQILSSVKSNSFFVQSRPNNKKASPPNKRKNQDNNNQSETKKNRTEFPNGESSESENSPSSPSPALPEESPSHNESSYVDITDLLTLPQKNAAQYLGISESMLCKRFKECTKRKWPYRYLRKIDKVISMLKDNKTGRIPQIEDKQRLEKLEQERQECLRPVKIRITLHDRLLNLKQNNNSPVSSPPPTSPPTQSSSDQEESCPDQDELEILETLQLLKSSSKKPL